MRGNPHGISGAVLSGDVHDTHELTRRIALAKADFISLSQVWRHPALTRRRKLALYSSLVESRLLYGLGTLFLTKAQRRRVNGFQNRCLRVVAGIKPSYISRVPNVEVLRATGHHLATDLLQQWQIQLLGRVMRAPEGHPLRVASFVPCSNQPATERYVRRVGRPSMEWVPEMLKIACSRPGSLEAVEAAASSQHAWSKAFHLS